MDVRTLKNRHDRRQQSARGSLPLKKRMASYSLRTASPHMMLDHRNKTASTPASDETLAALALIQASSGAADASTSRYQSHQHSPNLPLLPHMERENEARLSLLSLHRRAFIHESAAPTSTLFVSKVPGLNSSQQRPTEDTIEVSTSASDITMGTRSVASFSSSEERGSRQNQHHPSTALYRRPSPVDGPYPETHRGQEQLGLLLKSPASTVQVSAAAPSPQDKRYTGLPHDARCKATTTRGRACAYVAANGTEYCNLHADRHGNKCLQMKQQQQSPVSRATGTSNKKATKELRIDRPVAAISTRDSEGASSKLPSPLVHLNLDKKPRGRRASKLAEKHAASPFFLLSMIPSDQWRGKQVSILTGPMKDEEGIVEKWSNGWVSVRIPNVGIHNRRSIELAIVKNTGPLTDLDEARSSSVGRPVARDAANPSPFSDLDLSHASQNMVYNNSQAGSNSIETPRTIIINVYRDTETPATNAEFLPIPSVTPGSTNSAFYVPVADPHDQAIVSVTLEPSQTPASDFAVAKGGKKRTETLTTSFFHHAIAANKKHRII